MIGVYDMVETNFANCRFAVRIFFFLFDFLGLFVLSLKK